MRESKLQDLTFHRKLSWGILYVSPIVFLILLIFKPSTYGKLHQPKRNFFGPLVSAKWCWTVFESPNWVWVLICFYSNYSTLLTTDGLPNLILLVWFFVHYVHRSLIYPLSMSSESKFPIGILGATIPYCVVNGYLQAQDLCYFQTFPPGHIKSFYFVSGIIIMIVGFHLVFLSDRTLLQLRRSGAYHIPRGGMFELVSTPHYLGEILEWFGFAMATRFSLTQVSFLIWTSANLIPRALAQQEWYRQRFKDYPRNRKAILPFLL